MEAVAEQIRAVVAEGRIPSASIAIRVEGELLLDLTCGRARLDPLRDAAPHQAYDLASVTKALAGATVAAALLDPEDRASLYVPGVHPGVTIQHLLDHNAGYPAWAPLYELVPREAWGSPEARARIVRAAAETPLVTAPGEARCYSDLGFLTLLAAIEARGGARLDALFEELVRAPSGVDLRWGWSGAAATEDCPVRGEVVEGVVHDLNCSAMGGVSSHAGLFGAATDVARLTEQLLDRGFGWAGWDRVSPTGYTSTGAWWPRESVGHLGYTGTSVWVAPRQRVVVALLTNRVHPTDDKEPIRHARPRIHDALARVLGWDKARP